MGRILLQERFPCEKGSCAERNGKSCCEQPSDNLLLDQFVRRTDEQAVPSLTIASDTKREVEMGPRHVPSGASSTHDLTSANCLPLNHVKRAEVTVANSPVSFLDRKSSAAVSGAGNIDHFAGERSLCWGAGCSNIINGAVT
jgi:hypothetical protein